MTDVAGTTEHGSAELTRNDFERVRALIHEIAGIALSGDKMSMVQARLMPRLRKLGLSNVGQYLALIDSAGSPERQEFVNLLTTNLTSFYREAHHFVALEAYLREQTASRRLRIWCSAASTGEEVWSIAACAHRARGNNVEIIGTDIDTAVLARARDGIYPAQSVTNVDRSILSEFFQVGKGRHDGEVRIGERLRSMVRFAQLNLVDPTWSVNGPFDVIFCRNVMIYFDLATQQHLVRRFHSLLGSKGMLFVGHSETFRGLEGLFRLVGRSAYEKV